MCPTFNSKKESQALEEKWEADKKYHAARYVWKKRNRYNPRQRMTYQAWWEKMFNDKLEDYAEKMRDAKTRNSHNVV